MKRVLKNLVIKLRDYLERRDRKALIQLGRFADKYDDKEKDKKYYEVFQNYIQKNRKRYSRISFLYYLEYKLES